jgi:hypothetical protein
MISAEVDQSKQNLAHGVLDQTARGRDQEIRVYCVSIPRKPHHSPLHKPQPRLSPVSDGREYAAAVLLVDKPDHKRLSLGRKTKDTDGIRLIHPTNLGLMFPRSKDHEPTSRHQK